MILTRLQGKLREHVQSRICRLCESPGNRRLEVNCTTEYWHCHSCDLVYVNSAGLPSAQAEYDHYCQHENDPGDARYRAFLLRLGTPLLEELPGRSIGLDYGCGPGPGLAAIFQELGHDVALFDPFFAPDRSVLAQQYDFIICSEVAEHFHWPRQEFERLAGLLKPGGWMGIMTCFRLADRSFEDWHYRKDPTHVAFYSRRTFNWIAHRYGHVVEVPRKDVVLLQKPNLGSGV